MRKSSLTYAALFGILASSGMALPGGVIVAGAETSAATAASAGKQTGDAQRGTSKSAQIHRLGSGYARLNRAPVGKRYRASVRQHQRHAAKARRRAAHRAASR